MVVDMTDDLATVSAAAQPIIDDVVYATLATTGADGRPRTRVVHPVWWWDEDRGPRGLITSRPTPVKVKHLAEQPYVSVSYWSPAHHTVTIDGDAAWVPADRLHAVWDEIAAAPGPVGFDPHTVWPDGPSSDDYAVIEVRPVRVRVVTADRLATKGPYLLWKR